MASGTANKESLTEENSDRESVRTNNEAQEKSYMPSYKNSYTERLSDASVDPLDSRLKKQLDSLKATPVWMKLIETQYEEIRKRFMFICLAISCTILVLEYALLAFYVVWRSIYGEFSTPLFEFLLDNTIAPPLICFAALGAAWVTQKKSDSERVKNFTPVFALVVICTVIATAYCPYALAMSALCLPIFMVSIYGDNKMSSFTILYCAIGLGIAILRRAFYEYNINDVNLLPDAIMGYAALLAASLFANLLMRMFNAQRETLTLIAAEAEESKQTARNASMAKSNFLANMSHEIRTPLNAVIGMNEIINRKTSEPEIRKFSSDALQSSNALLSILGDIIDISKIESDEMEIKEVDYELGALISECYNLVALRLEEKGLEFEIVCEEDLPRVLRGDEFRIRQVIVNLLTNAVKYTEEGKITFSISKKSEMDSLVQEVLSLENIMLDSEAILNDSDSSLDTAVSHNDKIIMLEISVKDTGIGMREEDLPHLFDQFNRANDAKKKNIEGVGLGLHIAKQLVELMGGTIAVESVFCVGTRFTIDIPQKIVDEAPIGDVVTNYLVAPENASGYHQKFEAPDARILVVDDVPSNLNIICHLLESTKLKIDTAQSGQECLKMVQRQDYDLILMDHLMPKMDGVETLTALRMMESAGKTDMPVLALTANAMADAREKYIELGFVDYLLKPINGESLELAIMQYLPPEKVIET